MGHVEAVAAAGVHGDPAILVLDKEPRRARCRLFALVVEPLAYGGVAASTEIKPCNSSAIMRITNFCSSMLTAETS